MNLRPAVFKIPLDRKQVRALVGLAAILVVLPLASLAVQYPQRYRGRAAAEAIPENVVVSNIFSQGFSVSWTTDVATTGYLAWGTTVSARDQTQGDDRTVTANSPDGSPTYESNTHHVTVAPENRPSNGEFFFTIHSGTKNYGGSSLSLPDWGPLENLTEGGAVIRVVLPTPTDYDSTQDPSPSNTPGAYSTEQGAFGTCPTGELDANDDPIMNPACFRPYPIWGQSFESDFSSPVDGTLIYVRVTDNPGNTIKSHYLSTVADNQGQWVLELANAMAVGDTNAYLEYNTDLSSSGAGGTPDKISVEVRKADGTVVSEKHDLHRVTDTTPCVDGSGNVQRNTCENRDRCSMELPSPICINLGAAPSCDAGDWEDLDCGGGVGGAPTCNATEMLRRRRYTPAGCHDNDYQCVSSPSCAGDGDLVFYVKLQGGGRRGAHPATVEVEGQQFEINLTPVSDGKFVQTLNLSGASLVGNLTFKVKVDGYLQKTFQTTIVADQTNTVDWSNQKLLAGDFNGDNKITLDDFTGNMGILRVFEGMISIPQTATNRIFDLNGDQKIDVVDVSIVLTNFSGIEVPGED